MKFQRAMALLSPLLLLSSCATIVNGSSQSIGISTNPSNAEVWLDDLLVGRSPIILKMKRNGDHFVRIELDGYKPYELAFTREISGWVAGNLLFGGFIGLAVDAITGSIYNLTPDQVRVELHKGDIAYSKEAGDAYVAIVMKADSSWQKIGEMTSCD